MRNKKKFIKAFTMACFLSAGLVFGGQTAQAEGNEVDVDNIAEVDTFGVDDGVAIDETIFPDPKFRAYISEQFDTDQNGVLSQEEIKQIKTLKFAGGLGNIAMESWKGLEYFWILKRMHGIKMLFLISEITHL